MAYLFFKWLHIVAVISWMAGILYLYRILIYLVERGRIPENKALLLLMGRRLFKFITVPAMIAAYIGGLAMVGLQPSIGAAHWFMAKFLLVLILTHYTVKAGLLVGRCARDEPNIPSSKRLRWLNEIPTVLMLIIVYLVIFKP